jgi:hypothetical protein
MAKREEQNFDRRESNTLPDSNGSGNHRNDRDDQVTNDDLREPLVVLPSDPNDLLRGPGQGKPRGGGKPYGGGFPYPPNPGIGAPDPWD